MISTGFLQSADRFADIFDNRLADRFDDLYGFTMISLVFYDFHSFVQSAGRFADRFANRFGDRSDDV